MLFSWGVMYFVGGAPFYILSVIAGLTVVGGAVAVPSSALEGADSPSSQFWVK